MRLALQTIALAVGAGPSETEIMACNRPVIAPEQVNFWGSLRQQVAYILLDSATSDVSIGTVQERLGALVADRGYRVLGLWRNDYGTRNCVEVQHTPNGWGVAVRTAKGMLNLTAQGRLHLTTVKS